MIRKRYELEVNGKVVLRLKPKQQTVRIERPNPYGGWTDPVDLNREHVLELRDTLDEILAGRFCPPIKLSPEQVVGLDASTFIPCAGEDEIEAMRRRT